MGAHHKKYPHADNHAHRDKAASGYGAHSEHFHIGYSHGLKHG